MNTNNIIVLLFLHIINIVFNSSINMILIITTIIIFNIISVLLI